MTMAGFTRETFAGSMKMVSGERNEYIWWMVIGGHDEFCYILCTLRVLRYKAQYETWYSHAAMLHSH